MAMATTTRATALSQKLRSFAPRERVAAPARRLRLLRRHHRRTSAAAAAAEEEAEAAAA
jgi:hypothetical protein